MASKKSGKSSKKAGKKAGALAASSAASVVFTGFSATQISSLRSAKQSAAQQLLQPEQPATAFTALAATTTSPQPSQNLVGVGIGEKISGGKHTGVLAVKFLVRIKYPDNQVPPQDRLPTVVNGHPVKFVRSGPYRKQPAR